MRLPVSPGLEDAFPAPGWYWVPSGHHVAVYLAAGEVAAAITLHRLIEAQQHQEEAAA